MPTIFEQQTVFDTVVTTPIPEIQINGQPFGMRVALSRDWFDANPSANIVFDMVLDVSHDDKATWWDAYYRVRADGILRTDRGGNTIWYATHAQKLKALIADHDKQANPGPLKIWVKGSVEVFETFESLVVVDTFNENQWNNGDHRTQDTLPDVSGG